MNISSLKLVKILEGIQHVHDVLSNNLSVILSQVNFNVRDLVSDRYYLGLWLDFPV